MNKRITPMVFVALAAILASASLPAQDSYVVPAVVYTDDDKDRLVDVDISGGQVTVGHYLSDYIALEGVLGASSLSGVDDVDLLEYGVNVRLGADRRNRLSPYLLVGFGLMQTDSDLFGNDDVSFHTYGVGLNVRLSDSGKALRLEHRERTSSETILNPSDRITSLGFVIPFGAKDAPAPIVAQDPDSDGDGVKDSMDRCPNTPAGQAVDASGCPLDSDGDGVVDADDQCPDTVRGAVVDARGCELDDDNDGVVNRLDECPDTAAGVRVDVNGCEIKDVIELPGVNFETNSDRLLPGADDVLRDAAATLQKYPDLVVEVAGHTDSAGAADYNQGLSERRAATVRDYLINAGAGEANLSARGYGEADPIDDNNTADGRARNRRVELRIVEQ